jgi:putative peptidoglycan lipid II flippase
MAGLMVLSGPIVELLFGQGAFGDAAAARTAQCLFFLATGLWAFIGSRVFVTLHYAVGSFRDPFIAGILCICANLVLASVLTGPMGITGLALSVSLSSAAGFVYLVFHPPAQVRFSRTQMGVSACRALFVSAIMAGAVRWAAGFLIHDAHGKLLLGAGVITCVALGMAVAVFAARVMGFPEFGMAAQWVKKGAKSD